MDEEIGGYRFCLPRSSEKLAQSDFGPGFAIKVVAVMGVVVLWARLCTAIIESGRGAVGGILFFLGVTAGLAILVAKARGIDEPDSLQSPKRIGGEGSKVVVATVHAGGRSFATRGWLWCEDGLLRFRGIQFDFDLKPGDLIHHGAHWQNLLSAPLRLNVPRGLGRVLLSIEDKELDKPRGFVSTAGVLSRHFSGWLESNDPDQSSLFPPVRRPNPNIDLTALARRMPLACLGLTLLSWLTVELFADYLKRGNWIVAVVLMGLTPLLMLFSLLAEQTDWRASEQRIEELKELLRR